MKRLGYALLAAGFLGGAFFLVSLRAAPTDGEEIDFTLRWPPYLVAAAIMFSGLILVRIARSRELGDVATHHARLDVLGDALQKLLAKLGTLNAEKATTSVFDVHARIDRELLEDLGRFVDEREAMIHAHGMHVYAEVMSLFAGAERLINRAWSASVDGYVDEVWRCLEVAEAELGKSREVLASVGSAG